MTKPGSAVKEVIDRGIGTVVRDVEIYESDGKTLWAPGLGDRLVDGSVSVAYGDNERRTLDITLDNTDNLLRSNPNGFWYDKVIKVFRGVTYNPSHVTPKAAIIEYQLASMTGGVRLAAWLKKYGVDAVYLPSWDASMVSDYDILISHGGNSLITRTAELKDFYNNGGHVITISNASTSTQVPHIGTSGAGVTSSAWAVVPQSSGGELSAGWTTETVTTAIAGTPVASVTPDAIVVSRKTVGTTTSSITASASISTAGGKWFNLHMPYWGNTPNLDGNGIEIGRLLKNVVNWMKGSGLTKTWTTQVGEFVIDGINNDRLPSFTKVTARDYVKKCAISKIENPVIFAAGTILQTLVSSLANNAGVTKHKLDSMGGITLSSDISFDRGTPRWQIMQEAAKAYNFELFFDGEGYLTARTFLDPTLGSINYVFKTGDGGNVSTLGRGTNDSRIYNHIVVYGDPPSGEVRLPYVASATNTTDSSPTAISRIGDRYYSYASTFFSTQQQCQDYANRLLKLHALESYELTFSSINYPWVEVGEIAQILDPNAVAGDPDRYLFDTATIPLTLGPMSGTGKRVTVVG